MAPKRKQSDAAAAAAQKKPKPSSSSTSTESAKSLHETEYLKMLEVKKTALLGYATMSFADLKDMGKGLPVEIQKFNPREVTPARINALIVATGGDPANPSKPHTRLNRLSPEHAMFMLVKPRYIDPSSLRKDPFASDFLHVRWTSLVKDPKPTDVASLVNGNTRRELCLRLGQDAIAHFKTLRKSAGASEEEQKVAISNIRVATSWIVAFFDQGSSSSLVGCRN
jgi:hypothetical protein